MTTYSPPAVQAPIGTVSLEGTGWGRMLELAQVTRSLQTPPMSFEAFLQIGRQFPEFRMEQESNGQVTIMPPVLFGSGERESEANGLLWWWNRQSKAGKTFSASTGIRLPDGSTKQADTGWISHERLATFDSARLDAAFLPIAPDFVIEVRSKTDDVLVLLEKMKNAWIANGVRLAWLIDPYTETAHIFRADGSENVVTGFADQSLGGEEVLPGFEMELKGFKIA